MSKSAGRATERQLFNGLSPDQRLALVSRYSGRLRMLSRSMAEAGRPEMVEILEAVVDDLDSNANEIVGTPIGFTILAKAAGLIELTEKFVGDGAGAATIH